MLLVEDDVDTLDVTSMLVRGGNYLVATAETFAQALCQMREHEFDLLISDIALLDGTGLDLMREIQQHQKGIKGIALNGYGTHEDVRLAKVAGFAAHLTKPVSFPSLETIIREIVG